MTTIETVSQRQKGRVHVEAWNNRLRLRFTACGKRQFLSLSLSDTPTNRKVAEAKATLIESDLAWDRFDETLEKYKPQREKLISNEPNSLLHLSEVKIAELWEEYTAFKKDYIQRTTLFAKYAWVESVIKKMPSKLQHLSDAQEIAHYLITGPKNTPAKAKTVLRHLSTCCNWAVMEGKILSNPFVEILKKIKGTSFQETYDIRPFTLSEQKAIVNAFSKDENLSHYTGFVKFLFWTGCRPGEAIALKWKHISGDCTQITFAESVSGSLQIRKCTKTGKIRTFPVPTHLQELLLLIKSSDVDLESPVFVSHKGKLITASNFTRRMWKPALEGINIQHQRLYNTRHTFITECLHRGIDVVTVAKWVGNSPQVIYQHYAGVNPGAVPPNPLAEP